MCQGKVLKLVGIFSDYIDAQPGAVQPISEGLECDVVRLSVWAVEDDGVDTPKAEIAAAAISAEGTDVQPVTGTEIYYGFSNKCVHPLYPSRTSPDIPVANAKDVSVRANATAAAAIRVGISCFIYVEKEIGQ